MIKPKKKRKGDVNQVAHSVMQDIVKLSEKSGSKRQIKKSRMRN